MGLNLIKEFLIDFWVWWYFVNSRVVFRKLESQWLKLLIQFNLVPMAKNIFKPLYQDYSAEGLVVALPFRIGWIFFGSILQLLATAVLLTIFVIYFVIPVLPVIAFGVYIFS